MNLTKVIQIIKNKEWLRLKAIAEFELNIKQEKLGGWLE